MDLSNHKKNFLIVVGLALFLRILFLLWAGDPARYAIRPDSNSYINPALSLLKNGTFSKNLTPPLQPELARTPGYPLFLLPFVSDGRCHVTAVLITQAVLGALTVGLLYLMAIFYGKMRWPAWWPLFCYQ